MWQRCERMPSLAEVLDRASAVEQPEQTPEEQMAAARRIAAAFGAEIR